MNLFRIVAVGALLAASRAVGLGSDNQTTGAVSIVIADTNVVMEYNQLQAADDAAQADVDKWIRENNESKAGGVAAPETELKRRIRERFDPVGKAYADFLSRHPGHAKAHLSYGCFLNDRGDEAGARTQWEKALELDPKNAATYNNLAGSYSEGGPANKAFEYFGKAIELNPSEASYHHNFGNTLYVLRSRAMAYYGLTEQQVYAKTLQAFSNATRLDPTNLTFAWDLAQTYYALKPLPADDALKAWTNTLQRAHDESEREEIYVHCARVQMLVGRLAEARAQLNAVTNEHSATLKASLLHNIEERERTARGSNTTPGTLPER